MVKKIRNKNYKTAIVKRAESASAKLVAYMNSRPDSTEFVTFDEIRALVDSDATINITGAELSDGLIDHLAQLSGLSVVDNGL
jgi:hypothetical protein